MWSGTCLISKLYDKIIKNAIKISWDYPFKPQFYIKLIFIAKIIKLAKFFFYWFGLSLHYGAGFKTLISGSDKKFQILLRIRILNRNNIGFMINFVICLSSLAMNFVSGTSLKMCTVTPPTFSYPSLSSPGPFWKNKSHFQILLFIISDREKIPCTL
jgi:hypothetical protein